MTDLNALESLYFAALEKPAVERAAFLDAACGTDVELRARVERLLAAQPKVGGFLDAPVATADLPAAGRTLTFGSDGSATADLPGRAEHIGAILGGKYKLIEEIGEGGMGSVFMAQQTEPVKRAVAVKVIKAGMDSKAVLARFEAERQALAMMDHPNIARVLDAGTTESGRPYFVMELVKGQPITQFCDERKLTPRQRLELFVPVCQAIQHAHQKGIIHRDIKPSNVLVALYDDRPVPKVIDFGVAKATGQTLTDKTLMTGFGAVVGTPEYMSPEQANLNNLDIDTRSDVYSLGVLLYELLTGTTPVDRKSLGKAALLEVLRIVREVEAPRASVKLSSIDTLPSVAANRNTEPAKLSKLLRGELDWVLLKALEKDRTRRYDTANGLASDIQRYLADEMVEARPPSKGYRIKKVLRRNKGTVLATTLVMLVLIVGVVGTSWGFIQARSQRDLVEAERQVAVLAAESERQAKLESEEKRREAVAQKQRAEAGEKLAEERFEQLAGEKKKVEAQKKRVEEEKQIAFAVRSFLQNKLLGQADLRNQANSLLRAGELAMEAKENPTIRELLDRAAQELSPDRIERNFPRQPFVQAEILFTVGDAYRGIGEYERAIELLQRSVEICRHLFGINHVNTLNSLSSLAAAYRQAGKLDQALPLLEEAFTHSKETLGLEDPGTLIRMDNLALGYQSKGQRNLALPLFEEAYRLQKQLFGVEDAATLATMNNLGEAYFAAGKRQEALPLLEEALKIRRAKFGTEHPATLVSMNNLAAAYQEIGKRALALPLLEETYKISKEKLGPDHPATLNRMNNLARVYQEDGKVDLATSLLEESLRIRKAKFGPEHPSVLSSMNNLAGAYQASGRYDLAVPILEETFKIRKSKLGMDHPNTLQSMNNLAWVYQEAGRGDLALPMLQEALKLTRIKLGPDHPQTLQSMNNLAGAYQHAGKGALALPLFEETLQLRKAKLGPDHPDTLASMNNLAWSYRENGKADKVVPLLEETLERLKAMIGPRNPKTLTTMYNLGEAYCESGRLELALPLFEEAYRAGKKVPKLQGLAMTLLDSYRKLGKTHEAIALVKELIAEARLQLPKDGLAMAGQLANLGSVLLQLKAFGEAEPLLRECLAIRAQAEPDVWTTFNTQSLLGEALLGQNKYDEAEPLLLAGYEGMKLREKAIPFTANNRILAALDRLIGFYSVTNKPDAVKKWHAERAKYALPVAPMPREKK